MRTLLLVVALALTASVARAEVVVYQGSATALQPNDVAQYGKKPHVYYIVDLTTHDSYPIFYFTLNDQKQARGAFPLNPTRYNAAPGPRGTTIGNFSFVFDNGSVSNFSILMFYFRGKAIPLPTSSTTTGIFPKKLTGFLREATRNNGNPFNDEINFALTYDEFHTQAANNVLKSGATVYTDILGELAAKGYQ